MSSPDETTTTGEASADLVARVRAEFLEMPGLKLTVDQAMRLWSLAPATCAAVLDALAATHFLTRRHDAYTRS